MLLMTYEYTCCYTLFYCTALRKCNQFEMKTAGKLIRKSGDSIWVMVVW